MKDVKNKRNLNRIIDIIIIVLLLLGPGIRGYNDWYWYEYLLFVLIPVTWLIYDFIRESRKQ